jgi:hypothetical protein
LGAVEYRAAPVSTSRPAVSAGLLTGLVVLFLGAAVAAAAPAAAVDDPTRPDARVTHGPSCRPGGLVVEVVAGTAPYSVRLATTRTPSGEDEAVMQPGETVVLRTGDVAWGETIDGRLEYAAQDGSGVSFVDELEEYSFTRPTREDCDAVAAPSAPATEAPSSSAAPTSTGASTGTSAGAASSTGSAPTSAPSTGTRSSAPAGSLPADPTGGTPGRAVAAGDTVTLQASGFLPGERVTIQFHGSTDVLGTATAGPDGTVQAEVRIPDGIETGPATVDLVGNDSAVVVDVALQVAGAEKSFVGDGAADLVPLVAAAGALVTAAAGLVSVAGRQRNRRAAIRSA